MFKIPYYIFYALYFTFKYKDEIRFTTHLFKRLIDRKRLTYQARYKINNLINIIDNYI